MMLGSLKPDLLRCKLQKSPAFNSGRSLYSHNTLSFNFASSKLRISHKSIIFPTSPLKFSTANSLQVAEEVNCNPVLADHLSNCSSNFTTFQVFDIKEKLFGKLVSLILYGLLCFMAMPMFKHSAFAASYGRMGGSSSSKSSSYRQPRSSKSSSWSSSSSSSSLWSSSSWRPAASKSSSSTSSLTTYITCYYCYTLGRNSSTSTHSVSTCNCGNPSSISRPITRSDVDSDINLLAIFLVPFILLKMLLEIELWAIVLTIIAMILLAFKCACDGIVKEEHQEMTCDKGSFLMLQVGLLDKRRELHTEINRIAQIADTSNSDGLNFVLKEVVKALLQHYDSCHYSHLSVGSDEKDKRSKALFKKYLNRELERYNKDEETFANVDGVKYEKEAISKAHMIKDNDYSVVTILVLVRGIYKIKSWESDKQHVEAILQDFELIPKNNIQSVEVLWTPQRENEVVSEQELRRTFPLMERVNLSSCTI